VLTDLAVVANVRTRVGLPRTRKEVSSMPEPIRSMLAALLIIFLTFTVGCVQGQATMSNEFLWELSDP